MGDVNILLLGETGVGKTTLSDSILNYVKYESLNDVKFQSSSGTEEIIIGIDNNECQINIMSDTQHPTTNSLQYNGRRINITDTPGLGDTRGLGYDARNANAVINYLNRFDHLHGICLLLKPTDIRCNASFNFCVQKILSQLNRDVLNNVVFVFTNARSKNYKADDAKRSLNETLRKIGSSLSVNETNTFYFDNESLGYLTAKGANFLDVYQQSWDKSKSESERYVPYFFFFL